MQPKLQWRRHLTRNQYAEALVTHTVGETQGDQTVSVTVLLVKLPPAPNRSGFRSAQRRRWANAETTFLSATSSVPGSFPVMHSSDSPRRCCLRPIHWTSNAGSLDFNAVTALAAAVGGAKTHVADGVVPNTAGSV